MKRMKKSTYAQTLIDAVQAGSPTGLMTSAFKIQSRQENKAQSSIAISQGLPKTGITALHVAARLYSLAKSDTERQNAEIIVSILIERGAFLCVDAYINGRKQTPLEVCDGNAPKVLIEAVKQTAIRENNYTGKFAVNVFEASNRNGMEEHERLNMSGGYAFYYAV